MEQSSCEQEVYFGQYCRTCKYENKPEVTDPCNECLEYPTNKESHKPVMWEAK